MVYIYIYIKTIQFIEFTRNKMLIFSPPFLLQILHKNLMLFIFLFVFLYVALKARAIMLSFFIYSLRFFSTYIKLFVCLNLSVTYIWYKASFQKHLETEIKKKVSLFILLFMNIQDMFNMKMLSQRSCST